MVENLLDAVDRVYPPHSFTRAMEAREKAVAFTLSYMFSQITVGFLPPLAVSVIHI